MFVCSVAVRGTSSWLLAQKTPKKDSNEQECVDSSQYTLFIEVRTDTVPLDSPSPRLLNVSRGPSLLSPFDSAQLFHKRIKDSLGCPCTVRYPAHIGWVNS